MTTPPLRTWNECLLLTGRAEYRPEPLRLCKRGNFASPAISPGDPPAKAAHTRRCVARGARGTSSHPPDLACAPAGDAARVGPLQQSGASMIKRIAMLYALAAPVVAAATDVDRAYVTPQVGV